MSKLTVRRPNAFTLMELLVVVAVIAILAALLLPAISMGKDRAIRTRCMGNLKQFTMGMLAYGADYGERLPQMNGGYWPWDVPAVASKVLLANGITRPIMYDPGFPDQNCDALWDFTYDYRVVGYAMTFPGTATVFLTNQNSRTVPVPITVGTNSYPAPDASSRVLIAGAVISQYGQDDPAQMQSYQYIGIKGSWTGGLHRTAHVTSKKYPAGDNLGMLDGSVQWRNFKDMVPRTHDPRTLGALSPVFWW